MIEIDVDQEIEVAEYYQSLGITCGPGDIQYRLILLTLFKNRGKITRFSEIRDYTDRIADRGSIGSKLKTVFQLNGLAVKVDYGGYTITEKGIAAARFILATTNHYKKSKKMETIIERIPRLEP